RRVRLDAAHPQGMEERRHDAVLVVRLVSERLEVLERLAAGAAAVERLAGGGAEGGQALGVAAAAARTVDRGLRPAAAADEADRHEHRAVGIATHRPGRRDAARGKLAAPFLG